MNRAADADGAGKLGTKVRADRSSGDATSSAGSTGSTTSSTGSTRSGAAPPVHFQLQLQTLPGLDTLFTYLRFAGPIGFVLLAKVPTPPHTLTLTG